MTIEIVSLLIQHGGSFHSYMLYKRLGEGVIVTTIMIAGHHLPLSTIMIDHHQPLSYWYIGNYLYWLNGCSFP